MSQKRSLDDLNSQTPPESKTARFNAHTVRKLQAAINHDPEIDLTTQMPMNYTSRLAKMRASAKIALGKYIVDRNIDS